MRELIEILPPDIKNNEKGVVCAANESRFISANFSELLTAFTVGWKDPENIEDLLNFIAPVIHVGKRFEFKKADNAQAFLSENDDVRAIGSAFKTVDFTGTSVMAKTFNKGLTIRVDHEDVVGDDWRERYVQLLLRRLYRNELRRAITALNSSTTPIPKVWGGTDGSNNPDSDIRAELSNAADITGIRPNRIIFGESVWDLRSDVYDMQSTAAAQRAATLSMGDFARKLFVDEVRVFSARYQNSSSGKAQIVGNDVYLFHTQNDIIKDEPANIKRFVTPTDGSNFRVYLEEHSKFTDITVEHYSNIIVTSESGIKWLSVSAGSNE
ncbi:MAG: hypothetical protein LBI34_00070 [Puniceicoccales bacterium]|jgi:hypothetical protein|nr:hypothetical protein [Puniceicoccales bacterium]